MNISADKLIALNNNIYWYTLSMVLEAGRVN